MARFYIIISGIGGSGKSTGLCNSAKEVCQCTEISVVDCIKNAASLLGFDGNKTPKARKFLSDLKDLSEKYNDFPIISTIEKAKRLPYDIVFINAREEKDRIKLTEELGKDKTISVLVKRTDYNCASVLSNHADKNAEEGLFDYVLLNDGTFEEFCEYCKSFIQGILTKYKI